ncbi:hypothetical protein GCM10009616_20340 [Microlunatus lacustris]
MRRRMVAVVAALVLAGLGGALLLGYVGAADRRAMADLEPTSVLVVTAPVPEGADDEQLAASVTAQQLPRLAVAPGSVAALAELSGLVTTSALEPGEQVLRSRFADPAELEAARGLVVPEGLHQVSLALEPERALGGTVTPGAEVGVFLSTTEDDETQLGLHKVLVSKVTGAAPTGEEGGEAPAQAVEALMVTLALPPADAQRLVFAAEHGTVWLSAEPTEAPDAALPATTKENLYR